MNLRAVKKDIEYVLSAFVEDCCVCASVKPGKSGEKVNALTEEAISLYNELRDKAGAKVSSDKKAYFTALRKEMLEKTDALYEKLSAAVKEMVEDKAEDAAPAKAAPAKKAPAKKAPAKKEEAAPAKKAPAKKAPAKKAPAKKKVEE